MKKIAILLSVFSLLLASCGGSENKEKSKIEKDLVKKEEELKTIQDEIADLKEKLAAFDTSKKTKTKKVILSKIAPSRFIHSIDIQGRVDAEESVSVGPQMPGMVKRVNVRAGDHVSAGQILAELDADAMNQQLSALKIQRDLTKEIFDRQKNLWDQKIGSEIQYLQVKAQYESMEKQVSALQEQIDMTRIKAPMEGTVDMVGLKVGEMGSPGFTTIVIVNTSKLRVKGEVAEGYISSVKTGCNVQIEFPDAHKTLEAKMTYSGRMINKLNRTFGVEIAIPANEKDVVPNMIAIIRIQDHENDSAKVVPLSAIQQGADGKSYVYIAVKKGEKLIAERREVSFTNTYNGQAEIDAGLNFDDQVVTEGYADLNSGDEVSIN
jgi:membrane fusion protein, multidrug efflux system